MKFYLDCYACCIKHALHITNLVGLDEKQQSIVIKKLLKKLYQISPSTTAPEIAGVVYDITKKVVEKKTNDVFDPYKKIKYQSNNIVLALYDSMKNIVKNAEEPLKMAFKLAAVGNIIDYGVTPNIKMDINKEIKKNISKPFSSEDIAAFLDLIDSSRELLYIADNAGEIVFDRILIEEIKHFFPHICITFAVREEPIINDVTIIDAQQTGIDRICCVISSGSIIPGTKIKSCSLEFKKIFKETDVIISKGQGNFETLSDTKRNNLFFLLIVKCDVIAKHIGIKKGSLVFKINDRNSNA